MGYLEELQAQINNRNFDKFRQLWEEYCLNDAVDVEELKQILVSLKGSEIARSFGALVESALPLWEMISDEVESYDILSLLIDLQTTNSPKLHQLVLDVLKKRYGQDPQFNERLRLVKMRGNVDFQGALSNYRLLAHMAPGKFVYHAGGWGTGEMVDVSSLREQVTIEFENLSGRKHLTFASAFNALSPLEENNFLVRRFAYGDDLEKQCLTDPVGVLKTLLKDLGPKSAQEIKDALCDIVVPEKDWARWWQMARSKLKKDTMIEFPKTSKGVFKLRTKQVLHEDRMLEEFKNKSNTNGILLTAYNYVRDYPAVLKNAAIKSEIQEKVLQLLEDPDLNPSQELEIKLFLEHQLGYKLLEKGSEEIILSLPDIKDIVDGIQILALKKRALTIIRTSHSGFAEIFLSLLFSEQQSTLREYLLKELNVEPQRKALIQALEKLLLFPATNPEMFLWYFQLLFAKKDETLPFIGKEGLLAWFEAFLTLFHIIEFKPQYRLLAKKMYTLLTAKRYGMIRQIIEGTDVDFLKEMLLLASKCQTFTDTDTKTLRSLAAVVQPSLGKLKSQRNESHLEDQTLWTTEAAYMKMQEHIRHLGTTEVVANAREIEAARSLGDLRENSEYKFALEKRSRLQGDLKRLSDQMNHARIITPVDVSHEISSVGSVVTLQDPQGNEVSYTLLGPWDADPENNVLSIQSKFGQALLGHQKGDRFQFRDEDYQVLDLKTIFD